MKRVRYAHLPAVLHTLERLDPITLNMPQTKLDRAYQDKTV